MPYKWNKNISTGDFSCRIDSTVTLWRMAGNAPHLYYATNYAARESPRTGAYKTPKQAIKALRKVSQP